MLFLKLHAEYIHLQSLINNYSILLESAYIDIQSKYFMQQQQKKSLIFIYKVSTCK